ncbi:type II toxin-antitoxin system Phd/YefM family antitoxin [Serratia plymuthica]|uniref:type II toxin-antitoxin system Phd/YefM family antitoxin n=1 Tax=Serratia plymuthica TaxID=82996 RepID=UPI0018D9BE9A|nr:type II toxin-antitoxin system prevent-host-death family antitoxin [Serratia plymuthica]QPS58021.1 type II toxin-antitoxin system Phd/YefM family antitoxin [Serratia plymuthica]CAI1938622.1 Antitoxin of toxin-antitoxin stability system [Serratia plymuthica]
MKEITYTRFRADLSQVLDEIRDGETFVVTQRGKEPIVLGQGNKKLPVSNVNTLDNKALKAAIRNTVSAMSTNTVTSLIASQELEVLGRMIKAQRKLDPTTISALQKQAEYAAKLKPSNHVSIKDAVAEVRKRHAKTIKDLEDK